MNCLISMLMLVLWSVSGTERLDLLGAAVIFAALYIPELYINKKFESNKLFKEMLNKQFGTMFNKDK